MEFASSIHGWGTKILQAAQHSQKKKRGIYCKDLIGKNHGHSCTRKLNIAMPPECDCKVPGHFWFLTGSWSFGSANLLHPLALFYISAFSASSLFPLDF